MTAATGSLRRTHRLWTVSLLLGLVAAGWVLWRARPNTPVRATAVAAQPTLSSRFGKLTSARWAYGATYARRDLKPVANSNPNPEPQPQRDHPLAEALALDGSKLYVAMLGSESHPGHEVAVIDVATRKVLKRIPVGLAPGAVVAHPGGKTIFVLNRFSNYASIIDVATDKVTREIPLDFYCMFRVFNRDGTVAYVSNRYLNQILVLDVAAKGATAALRELGGFDDKAFLAPAAGQNVHQILQEGCGSAACHQRDRGGFYAGADPVKAFLSTVEHATPGVPERSHLLRATRSTQEGGYADNRGGANFHGDGRVIWHTTDPAYRAVAAWIQQARPGPGIAVENFESKPGPLALSGDGKRLFVGNQGATSISVIDTALLEEVTAIYTQSLITDLVVHRDSAGHERLIASSLGAGFGAPKERDPYGGETMDRANPAAQFTVNRDPATSEPWPIAQQSVLGPFDAVDGTAAFKMGDIQNDLLFMDIGRLQVPPRTANGKLQYAWFADRYQAHADWVRYTSDSAEVLAHDVQGDLPPELQRVVGAFPESLSVVGDDLYVTMLGTYELVKWHVQPHPGEPSEVAEPVAVYETGIMPRRAVAGQPGTVAQNLVFVSNFLGETVTVVDTAQHTTETVAVGNLERPFPDTNAERGEMFVNTAIFSGDQDTACMSCHIYGTSDGRSWGAGQAIASTKSGQFVSGGLLAIPQLRNLFPIQPFYFEGTHTAFDAQLDDAREHMPLHAFLRPGPQGNFADIVDPRPPAERKPEHEEIQDKMSTAQYGAAYPDLLEKRDELTRRLTMRYFGKAFDFRDFQRFIGEYQVADARLMPNPFDSNNASVQRGKMLFNDLGVGCSTCHKPPNFTDKTEGLTHNRQRALPSLVSFTPREMTFTLISPSWMDTINGYVRDVEPWEPGRYKAKQGFMTTFQLRGLFDRPSTFLHHGKAMTLRESFAAPDHYSLRDYKYPLTRGQEALRPDNRERGHNELTFLAEKSYEIDTHGATSHLTARQVQDLENFLLSLE